MLSYQTITHVRCLVLLNNLLKEKFKFLCAVQYNILSIKYTIVKIYKLLKNSDLFLSSVLKETQFAQK